jgi:hypothetical protein
VVSGSASAGAWAAGADQGRVCAAIARVSCGQPMVSPRSVLC